MVSFKRRSITPIGLVYGRRVNGIPGGGRMPGRTITPGMASPGVYEQIAVVVDDEGIAQFRWVEPNTTQSEETNPVSPISFPQAREIFEKMIPIIYGAQTYSVNPKIDHIKVEIDVNSIQLSMLRIRNPSATNKSGLLVPAWVFYGDIVSQTFWNNGTTDLPLLSAGNERGRRLRIRAGTKHCVRHQCRRRQRN